MRNVNMNSVKVSILIDFIQRVPMSKKIDVFHGIRQKIEPLLYALLKL